MISTQPDLVLLLHGLASHRIAMSPLAKALRDAGFRVCNWGYRSVTQPIEVLARHLALDLELLDSSETSRVHIVAHSMGSIITRRAIELHRPANLGRIVLLAPPNSGSAVARRLAKGLKWLCPPLSELSNEPRSYVNRLYDSADAEVGIIAAALDRVVDLESTHLKGARDHIVLPSHHTTLLWRSDTASQTEQFLKAGEFRRSVCSTPKA